MPDPKLPAHASPDVERSVRKRARVLFAMVIGVALVISVLLAIYFLRAWFSVNE